MEGIIIIGVLSFAIFGSMAIFAFIGYHSMVELGKRPGEGGKVMVPLIFKLAVAGGIIIAFLMGLLEIFG